MSFLPRILAVLASTVLRLGAATAIFLMVVMWIGTNSYVGREKRLLAYQERARDPDVTEIAHTKTRLAAMTSKLARAQTLLILVVGGWILSEGIAIRVRKRHRTTSPEGSPTDRTLG